MLQKAIIFINLICVFFIGIVFYMIFTKNTLFINDSLIMLNIDYIKNFLNISISVLSAILGALLTVHLVSIQLVGRKPYSTFNFITIKSGKLYIYIFLVSTIFLFVLILLYLDIIFKAALQMLVVNIIICLLLINFLNLIKIIFFQSIIFDTNSFLYFILREFSRKKIQKFYLLDITEKENKYILKLNMGGNGNYEKDVLEPFHQILFESFVAKDKVFITICLDVFAKHILKIHGLKYHKVLDFEKIQIKNNRIIPFYFKKNICKFINKKKVVEFFIYTNILKCKNFILNCIEFKNKLKSRIYMLLNYENLYALVAGLHFLVIRYNEFMDLWDDERNRKCILSSLGNIIYSFSKYPGYDTQIEYILYAVLSICLLDKRISTWGIYEPLLDILKNSNKLEKYYPQLVDKLYMVVAYCNLKKRIFFERENGIRPFLNEIDIDIMNNYLNTKETLNDYEFVSEVFPENIWNRYINYINLGD